MAFPNEYLNGFENGVVSILGAGYWDQFTGGTIDATNPRNSGRSLLFSLTAVAGYGIKNYSASKKCAIKFMAIRWNGAALPLVDHRFGEDHRTGDAALVQMWFIASTGKIELRLNGTSEVTQQSTMTLAVGQYYVIAYRVAIDATTWTIDWYVNDVAQTQLSLAGQGTTDVLLDHRLGSTGPVTADFRFDDYALSTYATVGASAADWAPAAASRILVASPNADGTHVNQGNFSDGSAISGANPAWDNIDDVPFPTGVTQGDFVAQTVRTGAGDLVQLDFPNDSAHTIGGVQASIAFNSASNGANDATARMKLLDASTQTIFAGNFGVDTHNYKTLLLTPPGAGWTAAEFNALKLEFGLSTGDVTPNPALTAAMLEYWVTGQAIPVGTASDVESAFTVVPVGGSGGGVIVVRTAPDRVGRFFAFPIVGSTVDATTDIALPVVVVHSLSPTVITAIENDAAPPIFRAERTVRTALETGTAGRIFVIRVPRPAPVGSGPLPYLSFCDVEVANAARAVEYLRLGLANTLQGHWQLSGAELCSVLYRDAGVPGGVFLGPALDPAPWFDPLDTSSQEFLGMILLRLQGYDGTISRASQPLARVGGGMFGRQQRRPREWRFRAALISASPFGAEYGLRWLTHTLQTDACASCSTCHLTVRLACPPDDGTADTRGEWTSYDVALVEGPTEVQQFSPRPSSLEDTLAGCRDLTIVEFTMLAGNPYLYQRPVVCLGSSFVNPPAGGGGGGGGGTTVYSDIAADPGGFYPGAVFPGGSLPYPTYVPGPPPPPPTPPPGVCCAVTPPTIGSISPIFTFVATGGMGAVVLEASATCGSFDPDPVLQMLLTRVPANSTLVVDCSKRTVELTSGGVTTDARNLLDLPVGRGLEWLEARACDTIGCFCVRAVDETSGGATTTVSIQTQIREG